MSFLTCSIIVVLGCVFSQQNVEAQIVNPSTALNMYPYVSPYYGRPSYLSETTDEQLLAISRQYGIRPDYMYQMYEILNSYTALTIDQDLNILRRVGGLVDKRRLRYGLPSRGYYGRHFHPNAPTFNMLARREPQMLSGLVSDIKSNFNGAMNSLSNTMNYYFPNFMNGLDREWNDIMGYEIPETIASDVSDLGGRMTNAIGSMLRDIW